MLMDSIFELTDDIRYVAIYKDGHLEKESKPGTIDTSEPESDVYEELLVNPTVLKLTSQRGNIDCGGLEYVLIRYGNFFQLVIPMDWGHVSVCVEPNADPISITNKVRLLVHEANITQNL